jgi:hypothetical protein
MSRHNQRRNPRMLPPVHRQHNRLSVVLIVVAVNAGLVIANMAGAQRVHVTLIVLITPAARRGHLS